PKKIRPVVPSSNGCRGRRSKASYARVYEAHPLATTRQRPQRQFLPRGAMVPSREIAQAQDELACVSKQLSATTPYPEERRQHTKDTPTVPKDYLEDKPDSLMRRHDSPQRSRPGAPGRAARQ